MVYNSKGNQSLWKTRTWRSRSIQHAALSLRYYRTRRRLVEIAHPAGQSNTKNLSIFCVPCSSSFQNREFVFYFIKAHKERERERHE
jgi:hypothetical protein